MRPVIKSRQEFDDFLTRAIAKLKKLVVDEGGDPVLVSVLRQLEAIGQWTSGGQDVTPEQDESLVMGIQALREMADFPDAQDLVVALDGYIKTVMVPDRPL